MSNDRILIRMCLTECGAQHDGLICCKSITQINAKIIVPHNSNAIAGALYKKSYKTIII